MIPWYWAIITLIAGYILGFCTDVIYFAWTSKRYRRREKGDENG